MYNLVCVLVCVGGLQQKKKGVCFHLCGAEDRVGEGRACLHRRASL